MTTKSESVPKSVRKGKAGRAQGAARGLAFRRRVPLRAEVDVFVAGGGPAGVAAAATAARQGRRVLLVEGQACCGGSGTAGMLPVGPAAGGGNIGHTFGVDGTDERSLTRAFQWARKSLLEYQRYYLAHKRRHRATPYRDGESYGIPYRCLVPRNLRNVLVAGRCVSTDRWLQSSIRVMPGCFITGQAAGMAAGMMAEGRRDARRIDVAELQARLKAMGAFLPNA